MKKFLIFIYTFIVFVGISSTCFADTVYNESFGPKYSVPPFKVWVIKFNKNIDINTVNTYNVRVNDENGNSFPVDVKLFTWFSNKAIFVIPKGNYANDKNYSLVVSDSVKTTDGKNISKPIRMYFKIKNIYEGLPYQDGMIIVNNDLKNYSKAYSMGYLANNSTQINEIKKANNYYVYYCHNDNGAKIEDAFSLNPVNAGLSDKKYDNIIYYAPDGTKILYRWNSSTLKYEKIPPTINGIVENTDTYKLVKITSADGIPEVNSGDTLSYKLEHNVQVKTIGETINYNSGENIEKVYILNGKGEILAEGNLDVSKNNSNISLTDIKISDRYVPGNTSGNLNSNGVVLQDDNEFVYYSNTADSGKIYRMFTNGIDNQKICEDNAKYLNVQRDWIYYSNYSDGGKIYKIRTDGTMKQKVCDDIGTYLTVSGDYIYYSNHSDGGKLYRIKTDIADTVSPTNGIITGKLYGENLYSDPIRNIGEAMDINISGEYIYFINKSDNNKPYAINKDLSFMGKVSDNSSIMMQIVGDYIYYVNPEGKLFRTKKSGLGSAELVFGGDFTDKIGIMNISGNWIYYKNLSDNGKLYKINMDGMKQKVSDDSIDAINIAGDNIFYLKAGALYKISSTALVGTKPQAIIKPILANKVTSVQSMDVTVDYYDALSLTDTQLTYKYLPLKMPAIMDDGSVKQVLINWDTTKYTFKSGVRTYTGDTVGYGVKAQCNMVIPSKSLNISNRVTININSIKDGSIKVDGLIEGDIITVYNSSKDTTPLAKSAVVLKDGIAYLSKLSLPYTLWISVTNKDKAESDRISINTVTPATINSVTDGDFVNLGIDGRDITAIWSKSLSTEATNQYIYILPKGTTIDIEKMVPSGTVGSATTWTGTADTKISNGQTFKAGDYDVYVVTVGPYGKTASTPYTITLTAEARPAQPKVDANLRIPGSGTSAEDRQFYAFNIYLAKGLTAYMIPSTVKVTKDTTLSDIGFDSKQWTTMTKLEGKAESKDDNTISMPVPMEEGYYKLYLWSPVGFSDPSLNSIYVDSSKPSVPEIYTPTPNSVVKVQQGGTLSARTNENATLYLVQSDTYNRVLTKYGTKRIPPLEVQACLGPNSKGVKVNANIMTTMKTDGLAGYYYIVAVDLAGNVSDPTGKVDTITSTLTSGSAILVDADKPYFLDVTIVPDTTDTERYNVQCKVDEDGWVYLVNSVYKITDKTSLDRVSAKDRKIVTVIGNDTNPKLIDTTGLPVGSYTLYALDKAGNISFPETDVVTMAGYPLIKATNTLYSKETAKGIDVQLTLNGNQLEGIYLKNADSSLTVLSYGSDYNISSDGKTITILPNYLSSFDASMQTFIFKFTPRLSKTQQLQITIDKISVNVACDSPTKNGLIVTFNKVIPVLSNDNFAIEDVAAHTNITINTVESHNGTSSNSDSYTIKANLSEGRQYLLKFKSIDSEDRIINYNFVIGNKGYFTVPIPKLTQLPKPAIPSFSYSGNSFDLRWQAVSNTNNGYEVRVYEEGNAVPCYDRDLQMSDVNAEGTGVLTMSIPINSFTLHDGKNYYATITALGSDPYANSDESDKSANVLRPAAPDLAIVKSEVDVTTGAQKVVGVDATMEYSYDGNAWITCSNTPIAVPSTNKTIYVRVKAVYPNLYSDKITISF